MGGPEVHLAATTVHHVRLTAGSYRPIRTITAVHDLPEAHRCFAVGRAAPDRSLTHEFRSDTTTEGERNRFYPTATFVDRETRESVIAHSETVCDGRRHPATGL